MVTTKAGKKSTKGERPASSGNAGTEAPAHAAPPVVVIFEKHGKYHVEPGTVRCPRGTTEIVFRNFTGKDARVWIPALDVSTKVIKDQDSLKLPRLRIAPGVYEYAVSIEVKHSAAGGRMARGASWLAEGNSAPRMVYD